MKWSNGGACRSLVDSKCTRTAPVPQVPDFACTKQVDLIEQFAQPDEVEPTYRQIPPIGPGGHQTVSIPGILLPLFALQASPANSAVLRWLDVIDLPRVTGDQSA